MNKKELKKASKYYDDFSNRYDKERAKGYFGFITNLEINTVKKIASAKKTLEIGCGTGLILKQISEVSSHSIGVDLSEGMIEACNSKSLNAVKIDGKKLPFNDEEFDLVYSFKVLPHIPHIEEMLKEVSRVTKTGGHLVVEYYGKYSFKFIIDRLKNLFREKPVYLRHDSLRDFYSYVPKEWKVESFTGIRIFGFSAYCYTLPVISSFFKWLDKKASKIPILNKLSGYCVVEFRKV